MNIGAFAQFPYEPPQEVGVFMEIVKGLDIDGTDTLTNSDDVRFNAYFIPPDSPNVSSFHIIMRLNDSEEILNFNLNADGSGAPEGVEIFEEEDIWYVYTESYTGVESYSFECSVEYSDGTESAVTIFESED